MTRKSLLVHRCQSTSGNSSRTAALMSAKASSEAGAFPWGQKDCTKLEKQTRLPDLASVCEGMIVDLPFCRFGQGLLATFHVVNTIHWKVPCRTRAAHVQHDHFTCKFTIKMPVWQLSAPQGHFKRTGEHFAPLRENQRNLQQKCSCCTSCCTHVCCTLVACVFSGISFAASKVLGWQHVFGAWCGTFVAGARF